ncbi:chaplin [Streptomyces sp. NPDC127108]|uniref:chaplin n=1 Tax=Streptomyces sp. NPDC127108 TaxID=3345361 RepID=UPI0036437746
MKNVKKAALVIAAAGLAAGAASGSAFASDDGASAEGAAVGSPGVGSGNLGQVPVHVPVNVVGNTANLIGALNPAFGNSGTND